MYHSEHHPLDTPYTTTTAVAEEDGSATSRGMKLCDSLDRRLRFSPPQPRKKLTLSERDHLVFEILNRHGPLPSAYLVQFTRHKWRDETGFKKRLTALYHGTMWMGQHVAFLAKPNWQRDSELAHWQHLIYDITDHARTALRRKGTLVIDRESEHPLHRFMGACVTASLKVYIESRLHEYHDLYKILCHEKCPQATRELDNALAIPREPDKDEKLYDKYGERIAHTIIPDHLFSIEGDTTRATFYAMEIDRGTETTKDTSRTSLGRKFKHYDAALDKKSFEKHFGFPGIVKILIITNSKQRRDNLSRYYKAHGKHPNNYLFSYTQGHDFDYGWRIPPLFYFEFIDGKGEPGRVV